MEEEHLALTVTTENFKKEVLEFSGVVLVDFWAPWCGPCRVMGPRIEELAATYTKDSQVKICKLNIDEHSEISNNYRVLSIPTFKLFAHGEAVDQRIGIVVTAELDTMIKQGLQKLQPNTAAIAL